MKQDANNETAVAQPPRAGTARGGLQIAWGGWMAAATGIVSLVLAVAALKSLGTVLKPLAFAWVLMLVLAPMVKACVRWLRIPETLAIVLSVLIAVYACFEIGAFINSLIATFVPKYGEYADKLQALLKGMYSSLHPQAVAMLREFDWQSGLSKRVLSLSGMVISASSTSVMVFIITAFLLIERRDFGLKVASAFADSRRILEVVGSISTQVSRYLILQCVISAATGVATWLALWAIGIDFSVTWGFLAFLLNFIPTIGSILAAIPPLLIALVQYAPETYIPFFEALASILAIQMLIGNVISPRVMGNHLNLSPVAILVSLLFWNWLWGVPGALLATPVTAALKIVCDNIEVLRPVGILLGSGRPLRRGGAPDVPDAARRRRSHRRRQMRNRQQNPNQ
ncbi:MAG: AI-2E family transporter [Kiritimatiellae bacterium]|nr:AI-2E family transporter [Kiritimatiellia bacterium]